MDVKMKLVDWVEGNYLITDTPNPRGEIHVGGNNVALGYYKNKPKTEEDFYDDEGLRWFRTGDIGEFDQDGVIRYGNIYCTNYLKFGPKSPFQKKSPHWL